MTNLDATKVVTLGELFDFSNGLNTDRSAYGSGIPFANVLEIITHDALDESKIPGRVNIDRASQQRYAVRHGDVLFNRTSETQGEVGLASTYLGSSPIVFGGFVLRGQPKTDELDINYSKYALRAPQVRRQIVARGQGGIRANVGQRDLATVEVQLPPITTQKVIAGALDDVSALITSIERVIAKKRDIKHGMMQELLTGQTRLPGFEDNWQMAPISDLATIVKGQQLGRAEMSMYGEVEVWNGGIEPSGFTDVPNIFHLVVTISEGGNSCGWVGQPQSEFWLGGHCYALTPKGQSLPIQFLYQLLKMRELDLMALRVGSGLPNIQKRALLEFLVLVPLDMAEATRIGEILKDTDDEIAALERRLESTRAIKQGMIQEMLSGRTRLTEGVAA